MDRNTQLATGTADGDAGRCLEMPMDLLVNSEHIHVTIVIWVIFLIGLMHTAEFFLGQVSHFLRAVAKFVRDSGKLISSDVDKLP